ncbi:hypothetical protein G6F65_019718 [Rhizopus arrhizus]|nr:hypothetical protein G6F65_019718 [Rhizopus arrhizus]
MVHHVRDGEGGIEEKGGRFHDLCANRDQHFPPVVLQRFLKRNPGAAAGGLDFLERRRFAPGVADPHADHHLHDRAHEGNAPPPGLESVFAHAGAQQRGNDVAQGKAQHGPRLRDGAIEAALRARGILHGKQHPAAPLAAQR